tara:strand:+ start:417 stop:1541 length:1125 start_codon:yes stop_codon:yes gene_type:complete
LETQPGEHIAEIENFLAGLEMTGLTTGEKEKILGEIQEYDRYKKFNEGGFADVYLDKVTKNVVRKLKSSVNVQLIMNELESYEHFKNSINHKNFVKVVDIKYAHNLIIMEFGHLRLVDNATNISYSVPMDLQEFVSNKYKLGILDEPRKILNILTGWNMYSQLIDGLKYLHKQMVVHRDIKPENILVCGDWGNSMIFKFTDFGLSELITRENIHKHLDQIGKLGSSQYCSPPLTQETKQTLTPDQYNLVLFNCDFWSLMITFYSVTYGFGLFHPVPIKIRNKFDENYLKIMRGEPLTYSNSHERTDKIIRSEIFNNCKEGTEDSREEINNLRLFNYFIRTIYSIRYLNFTNTEKCIDQCDLLFKKLQYCIENTE